MKKKTRFLSMMIAVLMLCICFSFPAFAYEEVTAVDATIKQLPYTTTVYKDAEYDTLSLEGLEIDFKLSDGSVEHWSYETNYDSNLWVKWDFLRDENNDILIKNNKAFMEVCSDEASVTIEFDALENPVKYIEVTADPIVITENTNGEKDITYNEYGDDIIFFNYNYDVSDDAKIIVYYKDGTKVTAGLYEEINGFYPIVAHDQYSVPWVAGGENCLYVSYMGKETTIPVEILPSLIENIEVTKAPDKSVYEFGYHPIWIGAKITLTLKDGTTEVITVTEDNIEYDTETIYEGGSLRCRVSSENFAVNILCEYAIHPVYDNEYMEYYIMECQGVKTYYYDIEFVQRKEVESVSVEDFNLDLEQPMKYIVKYKDGETRTFEYSDFVYSCWDSDSFFTGYILSDYGILYTDVTFDYEDDELVEVECSLLRENVCLDPDVAFKPSDSNIFGDADGSGKVNVRDATIIQKHAAGIITLSEEIQVIADVDDNGKVNVKDATAIQKYVAGMGIRYPIGETVN